MASEPFGVADNFDDLNTNLDAAGCFGALERELAVEIFVCVLKDGAYLHVLPKLIDSDFGLV